MDWSKELDFVQALLKTLGAPSAAMKVVAAIMLLALAIKGLHKALTYVGDIRQVWVERIKPIFYDAAKKRRVVVRQQFADHIESEIRRLDRQEDWRDHRFAELEAEVEAEIRGTRLPWKRDRGIGRRRERSLSKALARSDERLILLEGEPGAGKSVALRHVARQIAAKAMTAKSVDAVIPLYVNLKGLERKKKEAISPELIRQYVIDFLTKVNNRHVTEILESEFEVALAEGTWLFLFDSFDEIPEVLSSTEADSVVREYADAIASFLSGPNRCRGVIASRQFRGPKSLDWPRFRITALSRQAQRDLIGRADLEGLAPMTIGRLQTTQSEIAAVARTPLFLGLVCEYVREHKEFPESAHSVFESYVDSRLKRDTDQLKKRFDLNAKKVRGAAEQIAFAMASDEGLGLSVTRGAIRDALAKVGDAGLANDKILNALEYIKLARADNDDHGDARTFTFAHRRFQEYFATCVVLRDTDIVPATELLLNARWRETAVVIFQTQIGDPVRDLVATAGNLLDEMVTQLRASTMKTIAVTPAEDEELPPPSHVQWPSRVLHLLGLLQSGFNAARVAELPPPLRAAAAEIVLTAAYAGSLADLRSALDVAGIVPQDAMLWTIRRAFATKSRWVVEVGYRQVARLTVIPEDISRLIGTELLRLARTWRMSEEKDATYAHVARMHDPGRFLASLTLLQVMRWVEPVLVGLSMLVVAYARWDVAKNVAMSLPAMLVTGSLVWYFARFLVAFVKPVITVTTDLMVSAFGPLAGVAELVLANAAVMLRLGVVSATVTNELVSRFIAIAFTARKVDDLVVGPFVPIVLLVPLLSWTAVGMALIRIGAVPRPVFYPFLHLIAIRKLLGAAIGAFVSDPKTHVKAVGVLLLLGAVSVGGIYLIRRYVGDPSATFFLGVFGVVFSPFVVASVVLLIGEFRRLRAFRRRRERFWSGEELVELLRGFRTSNSRLTVLREVRKKHLLEPSPSNELTLRDAALVVERSRHVSSVDTLFSVAGDSVIRQFRRERWEPTLGSAVELAEELHRLAETLESQRVGK